MTTAASERILRKKKASSPTLALFEPVVGGRSLTHELARRLTADITAGNFASGARLPTEQEIIAATGVSRTVVREAFAALRAQGLIVTRQGVGAFVADNSSRPFRIDAEELRNLRKALEVMELRTGVEIEAAGLAAARASVADRRRITAAYGAINSAIARDEAAVDEDFAFHLAVAAASANPQFVKFLQYLGHLIIPRQIVGGTIRSRGERRLYLQRIQREHRDIRDAILRGAVAQARAAMRRHLLNSRRRYQKLASELEAG